MRIDIGTFRLFINKQGVCPRRARKWGFHISNWYPAAQKIFENNRLEQSGVLVLFGYVFDLDRKREFWQVKNIDWFVQEYNKR